MQIDVEFHPEARLEYLDAIAWYLTHSKSIARAFQQEVHLALDRIQQGPHSGQPLRDTSVGFV